MAIFLVRSLIFIIISMSLSFCLFPVSFFHLFLVWMPCCKLSWLFVSVWVHIKYLQSVSYHLCFRLILWIVLLFNIQSHAVPCDRLLKHVLSLSKAKIVFVATDRDPMINHIEEHFKNKKVLISCGFYCWCVGLAKAVPSFAFYFQSFYGTDGTMRFVMCLLQ